MRATLARAAGLAAVLLSALTLSASPAAAGGPTSASAVHPGGRQHRLALLHRSRSTTSWPTSSACRRAERDVRRQGVRLRPRVRRRRHRHLAGPRRRAVAGRPHLPGRQGRPVDLHPGLGLQRQLDLGEPGALAPARGRRTSRRPARRPGTGHQGVEGHLLRRRRRRTPSRTRERQRRTRARRSPAEGGRRPAARPGTSVPAGRSAAWSAGALLALAWTRRRPDRDDEPEPALGGADGYAEVLAR